MKTTLIIAFKQKDKIIANQLRKLIETKDDTDEKIIGTEDCNIAVILWDEKIWVDNDKRGDLDSKVILIDNVKGSSSLLPIIDVKYQKYGITYGWAGTHAVISIDEKGIRKKEDYNDFLEELRSIAPSNIAEYDRGKNRKQSLKESWKILIPIPILPEHTLGKIINNEVTNAKTTRQQMLIFAVTHFYYNNLVTFLKE